MPQCTPTQYNNNKKEIEKEHHVKVPLAIAA
jgi:hypothetical protein